MFLMECSILGGVLVVYCLFDIVLLRLLNNNNRFEYLFLSHRDMNHCLWYTNVTSLRAPIACAVYNQQRSKNSTTMRRYIANTKYAYVVLEIMLIRRVCFFFVEHSVRPSAVCVGNRFQLLGDDSGFPLPFCFIAPHQRWIEQIRKMCSDTRCLDERKISTIRGCEVVLVFYVKIWSKVIGR